MHSPNLTRERFSGIQGGVLSGVAPPEQRRRKESEGVRSSRVPSGSGEDSLSSINDRKSGSSVGDSIALGARNSRSKPSFDGTAGVFNNVGSGENGLGKTNAPAGSVATNTSWPSRRRDRTAGEGPIGPPSDGALGFGRFAGYDRKRERTGGSNADSWRSGTGTRGGGAALNTSLTSDSSVEDNIATTDPAAFEQPKPTLDEDIGQPDSIRQVLGDLNLDEGNADLVHGGETPSNNTLTKPDPTWSADEQQWLYRDPSGQVQGPFAATLMQSWYEGKYFTDDLMIRPEQQPDFRPLAEFAHKANNNPALFLSPPPNFDQRDQPEVPSHTQPAQTGPVSLQDVNTVQAGHHDDAFQAGFARPDGAWSASHSGAQQSWSGHQFNGSAFGAAPSSPFVGGFGGLNHSPFGPQLGATQPDQFGLDARLKQQEFYAMMQRRELENSQINGRAGGLTFGQFSAGDQINDLNWPQQHQHQHQRQPWGAEPHQQQGSLLGSEGPQSPWLQSGEARELQHQQQPSTPWKEQRAAGDYVGVIGTPVRSRSPAPEAAQLEPNAEASQVVEEQINEDPVDTSAASVPTASQEPVAHEELEEQTRPVTPQPVDPAPEQDWPQSPSAVEFASQPDFEQGSARAQKETESTPSRNDAERKDVRGFAAAVASRFAAGPGAPSKINAPSSAGGNVKIVQADQFRKGGAARSGAESPSVQAPLSSFLPSGNGTAQSPATAASKAAPWAQQSTDDNVNATATLSLREIQELEAKQVEARRNAERAAAQKRAAAAAGLRTPAAENLPTTMSWGLASIPSSVGKPQAAGTGSESGEVPSPAGLSQPAAWTAAAGGKPKKTLMEIQEEERKRALAAQRKAATALASTGRSDSLGPKPSTNPQTLAQQVAAAGPGWSVVGAGGKPTVPSGATSAGVAASSPSLPARPPVGLPQRTASTASIPGSASGGSPWSAVNGSGSAKGPVAQVSAATAARPRSLASHPSSSVTPSTSSSAVRDPSAPSPEFIKYFKDQLQGLSGVKMDDFIEMLLSFPLDPSPDVVEIIAESIYAHSSTLDGRRLANDFVAKRKMDAGVPESKNKGSGAINGIQAALSRASSGAINPTGGAGANGSNLSGSIASSGAAGGGHGNVGGGGGGGAGFQQVVKKGAKKRNNH